MLGLHVFSQTPAADSAGDSESETMQNLHKRLWSLQALSKMCKNFQVPGVLRTVDGVHPIRFNSRVEHSILSSEFAR